MPLATADAQRRSDDLRAAIYRTKGKPNLTPQDTANLEAWQQELGDLGTTIGQNQLKEGQEAPFYDQAGLMSDLQQSAQNQRQAIGDIYGNQRGLAEQMLQEKYAPMRRQAIEEAGVLGNLRSPAFMSSTLANIDAQKSRDLSNLYSQIGVGRGQALSGLEQGLAGQLQRGREVGAEIGLRKAGLLQGGQQFGQTFGLQQNQFGAGQRQQNFENMLAQQGLEQAGRLGQMQAEASKPSLYSQVMQGLGGLGGLLGGAGTLIGSFRKGPSSTPSPKPPR